MNNTLEQNKKSILKNGFHKSTSVNLLPIFNGYIFSIIDRKYGNHKDDMVYIIRKEGVNEKNGNYNIKTGYKPTENEVFKIEYDYQPTYEAYVNAMLNK